MLKLHVRADLIFNVYTMAETTDKKEITTTGASPQKTPPRSREVRETRPGRTSNERRDRRPRRIIRREDRKEFDQKIIDIRRVTRVVAGGRRFSFSVSMVIGDHKGKVGVGIGKAGDTALAIEKAARNAKKNIMRVPTTKGGTIEHEVAAKYCASRIMIQPAPGRGLVAGSSVRNVLELAGVRDVSAKILSRSKNRLNNAQAAIKALRDLKT